MNRTKCLLRLLPPAKDNVGHYRGDMVSVRISCACMSHNMLPSFVSICKKPTVFMYWVWATDQNSRQHKYTALALAQKNAVAWQSDDWHTPCLHVTHLASV